MFGRLLLYCNDASLQYILYRWKPGFYFSLNGATFVRKISCVGCAYEKIPYFLCECQTPCLVSSVPNWMITV